MKRGKLQKEYLKIQSVILASLGLVQEDWEIKASWDTRWVQRQPRPTQWGPVSKGKKGIGPGLACVCPAQGLIPSITNVYVSVTPTESRDWEVWLCISWKHRELCPLPSSLESFAQLYVLFCSVLSFLFLCRETAKPWSWLGKLFQFHSPIPWLFFQLCS